MLNPVPWYVRWLAVFGLSAMVFIVGAFVGYRYESQSNDSQKLADAKLAAEVTAKKQKEVDQNVSSLQTRLDAANQSLSSALSELRKRPERLPENARAQCKGTTGAELSAEDAEFLVRFAYDCQRESAALKSCYEYADTVAK